MRVFVLIALACLSACGWWRKSPQTEPTEIIVTGAPVGSFVFVDGVQSGHVAAHNDDSQILNVAAGDHKVEVHLGDKVVYREDTYVGRGEHRAVMVLSGSSR